MFWNTHQLLLAEGSLWSEFLRWASSPSVGHWLALASLVFALIAAVWGALWWSERRAAASEPGDAEPETLWKLLCVAHGVTGLEAERLVMLARHAKLADPAILFVDPQVLERAATKGDAQARDFARLGRQVFGDVFQPAT
jgi:hypothetical protein